MRLNQKPKQCVYRRHGILKCEVVKFRRGKREAFPCIGLPDGERIWDLDKNIYIFRHFCNWQYLMKEEKKNISDFFIIKGFRTIFFIFIVIFTMFRPICPPAFFRCLSNSGTFTKLQTTAFIESTGVACSDSIKDVVRSYLKVPEFDKHLKKAGGNINQNVVQITIRMKTIVRNPLMIKIKKPRLRNLDN